MVLQNMVGVLYFIALIVFAVSWFATAIGFPSNFLYSSFAFLIGSKVGMMVSSKVKGASVFALFLTTITAIVLIARYLAGNELYPNWLATCLSCALGMILLYLTSTKSPITAAEFLARRYYFYAACLASFVVYMTAAWASDFVTNPIKAIVFFFLAIAAISLAIKHFDEYPVA